MTVISSIEYVVTLPTPAATELQQRTLRTEFALPKVSSRDRARHPSDEVSMVELTHVYEQFP